MKPDTKWYVQYDSIYTTFLRRQKPIYSNKNQCVSRNKIYWSTNCKGAWLSEVMEMFHILNALVIIHLLYDQQLEYTFVNTHHSFKMYSPYVYNLMYVYYISNSCLGKGIKTKSTQGEPNAFANKEINFGCKRLYKSPSIVKVL